MHLNNRFAFKNLKFNLFHSRQNGFQTQLRFIYKLNGILYLSSDDYFKTQVIVIIVAITIQIFVRDFSENRLPSQMKSCLPVR